MEAKTIQERIRIAGRQRLPWQGMEIDDMVRACGVIDAVAAEFGDDRAYNPATHVVVSREAGKAASETIERCLGDGFREYFDWDELDSNNNALAELRAALEVQK